MAEIRVILNGSLVRFEQSGPFAVTHWSPFNRAAQMPKEEHTFSSLEAVRQGMADYAQRMKAYAFADGGKVKKAADAEEDAERNGLKILAFLEGGQRKPRGWGKERSLKLEFVFAECLEPKPEKAEA